MEKGHPDQFKAEDIFNDLKVLQEIKSFPESQSSRSTAQKVFKFTNLIDIAWQNELIRLVPETSLLKF